MKKEPLFDFQNIQMAYFVGIKGIAMAALAAWASKKGITVRGSDLSETFPSDAVLAQAGIVPLVGFSKEHITGGTKPDLVIFTGAHGGIDNVEVVAAKELEIPVLPHGKALGAAMSTSTQISVAGSHGKTTTTAMIATILKHAGKDPSYAIGSGEIAGLGSPGYCGRGSYFVAEADEYVTDPTHDKTPRFLWQKPEILVITNIDFDHPDVYASLSDVRAAFMQLMAQQAGKKITIINTDDPASEPLLTKAHSPVTYGTSETAMYRIVDIRFAEESVTFELLYKDASVGKFTLRVPGEHNVHNAAAAAIASHLTGVSWEEIAKGLAIFRGAKRRFEHIGYKNGISFYDDYAHHPKEIQATLSAARKWYPGRRIVAVFQPHTYSRTKKLLADFAQSFADSDAVVLTDIYASARENDTLGITGMTLVNEMKKYHDHVVYASGKIQLKDYIAKNSVKGDVIIFMGAGDIYSWEKELLEA
jgi:UDP-N-acetylmuramate--alanine ligase